MIYIFYVFCIFFAYLLGSIPMGMLITKMAGKGDLRQVGSGNIGATNVMRVGGLRLAGLVWLLDMLKAIIAVFVGFKVGGSDFSAWCGFVAVLGHCFPVWLKFRGGKGISCLFGTVLAVNPLVFLFCGIEWLIVALGFGYSSGGALIVFCSLPIWGFIISNSVGFAFTAIAVLCLIRHKDNIKRLFNKSESKIVWKWKK